MWSVGSASVSNSGAAVSLVRLAGWWWCTCKATVCNASNILSTKPGLPDKKPPPRKRLTFISQQVYTWGKKNIKIELTTTTTSTTGQREMAVHAMQWRVFFARVTQPENQ